MTIYRNGADISGLVSTVEWSGADTEASRSVTLTMLNDLYGPGTKLQLTLGDKIRLKEGKTLLFEGRVTTAEKTGTVGTNSVTCKDYMDIMLKSKVSRKYKGKTAESITKDAAAKVGISCGSLIKTNKKISKLFATDASPYSIAVKAYKLASAKTGKKYFPYMDGVKFCMKEKGAIVGDGTKANFVLSDQSHLTGATVSQTIDNMVNRVVVYNNSGKQIGVAKSDKNIAAYGVYQDTQSTGKKGKKKLKANLAAAKKKLKGKETTLQVESIGDIRCIAGAGVRIHDSATGLVGVFWIKSDTHKWEAGIHTMTLQLVYSNTMENPAVNYQKPARAKKSSSKSKSSGGGSGTAGKSGFHGKFRRPCSGPITSPFGPRSSPGGIGSTYHQGIDIGCSRNTKIKAAAAGTVSSAGWSGGYGKLVVINHGGGFKTYYGHNARCAVHKGQKVKQGQTIAYADSTGASTGNHCHFGIMHHGKFINPRRYV